MNMEKTNLSVDKGDRGYLEQIDGNSQEKSRGVVDYINSGLLPKIGNKTTLLEIGVGSGSSIQKIKEEIKDPNLVIYALDKIEHLAERVHDPESNIYSVTGDISELPFSKRSMSVINLSSILHEGISYNEAILKGNLDIDDYLRTTFLSLVETLEIGGVITYRDPGLPIAPGEECSITYSKAVNSFIRAFHNSFQTTFKNIIKSDTTPRLTGEKHDLTLFANRHYHREIQRHLITYLDLACRQMFNLALSEILKQYERGEMQQNELLGIINQLSTDEFIYENWYKREGSEVYTYRNIEELWKLLNDIKETGETEFEITEAYEVDRQSYSNLLNLLSDGNIRDTKQCLTLKRVK